jgi:antitoxin HicB
MYLKVPLVLEPQPEGGYTVTSPLLPELVTEGDSVDEALENVKDALAAVVEVYEDLDRPLPQNALADTLYPIQFETVISTS